ncbi:putative protease Do-like 14 [Trifolium pratense]|uniref:putative protease Do-like 14 n=1 Tax=Trifolium pratense TaxID=57577 RepID=UPI001E69190A|nr:putative protease Do-like 14 [Trifolium pratense]
MMNRTMRMHKEALKRKNPWFRENIWEHLDELNPAYYTPDLMHLITNSSRKRPKFHNKGDNDHLDVHTKKAVLKVSSSIVALLSYTGEQELTQCSGVIIENNDDNNGHIVLTSANLIRRPTKEDVMEDKLADALKVMIYLYDGGSYQGEVRAYDFHYNIAWIQFRSHSSLATAKLRLVDDYINVNPDEEKSFDLRPQSSHFNFVPGHPIVAVGRYFAKPFDVMAAPGEFTLGRCDFDCKELFMGTCQTTRCGEGGALINLSGEVIGIIYYYEYGFTTPFMPINIAKNCWEHYKRYGELRRPSLGVYATNFYTAEIYFIEKVIQKNPSICNGVFVEKVIQGSSADLAGLHFNDVIVQCGGKTVRSFLEFLEMVWDKKVGDVLQLSVVRASQDDPIDVNMVVDEVAIEKFNRWPRNL